MSDGRWVVLGLAHPRAEWFADLARWSTTASVAVDFVKCVSAEEVRARLTSGRAFSALLVGGNATGLDRDLVERARAVGTTTFVVDPTTPRDWAELGVVAVLPAGFDRTELLAALDEHATPVRAVVAMPSDGPADADPEWRGRVIAVTGAGGVGASTVAMSVAQAFATEPSKSGMVVLADLALDADLAMLHDAREVVPGVQELTEAHRTGRLPVEEVRSLVFDSGDRGYHLLLGLRRHRDWTAIRPRAFATALDGLRRSYRLVIADVDADLEGESLTGSLDVEDRNTMARTVMQHAEVVVIVGHTGTKGLHALARTVRSTLAFGVDADRIVPVGNRAPRGPRRRAEAVATLASLTTDEGSNPVGNPVFVAERRDVEDSLRDGLRLPASLGRALHAELTRRLDALAGTGSTASRAAVDGPVPVVAGSLGSWTEQTG